MDPRQQNQGYSGSVPQQVGGNYAFSGVQNDAFSSFVHTDNESAFDSSWNTQSYPAQQQPINGFDQGSHNWQQNSYQSSNLMPMSDYGVPPRDYDQPYPRSPAPFDYSAFISNPNSTFSPSEYDNSLGYGQIPLNTNARYDYTGQQGLQQQHHGTISPQALQSYPDSFPPTTGEDSRQKSQNLRYGQPLPVRRASATGTGPTAPQDWNALSSATLDSIFAQGMHIKPTAGLSHATKSTRVDGFTFVGNGSLTSSSTKAVIAKFRRRRTVKEFRSLLQLEKGSDTWHRDREPVLKKLKKTETQLSGPRSVTKSHSRSGSVAESASPTETSDSDSEDESEYYSESEVEVVQEEPSPLPAIRPADPSRAVEYDIIKAVWAKKSVGLSSTVIRTALGEYWDIFKGIRDKWKAKAASLQTAVDKKDQPSIKAYERRVQEQRRLLESCIRLTLKHGHPDLIEKLGESPPFIVIFYQFLAERFKDSEYSGNFIASILELMSHCATIDQALLEKTKMDKVLSRLVKRGDDEGRKFAQKVLENAAEVSKQKTAGVKALNVNQPNGTAAKLQKERSEASDSKETKKEQPAIRKPSTVANKFSSSGTTAKPSAITARQPPAKADAKASTKTAATDASGAKTKANNITAKPSGFFSSLKSASKKPGTSSKEDGKSSTGVDVKLEAKAEPSKPAFSFAATMATLNAQKEAPPVKAEETRKPETPDEKRKRLRKEQRRKLRVSFKADDDMVQVREFVHDPEEELGHEDSQVRDVGDSRGEGQMLKMHKDLDIDDEEDYEPPDEISLPEWHDPQPIDFGVLGDQVQAQNYTSRGGNIEARSEERAVQDQRELTTLMVIYTNPSDIPSSPREPSVPYSGDHLMEETFGTPMEEWFTTRLAEMKQREAARAAAQPPTPDISALLRIINSQKQVPPPQPQPVAPIPAPTGLEAIFAQFANQKQQASQRQAPQFNLQAALASMSQPNQVQPEYVAPQQAQVPNLQALIASFGTQPTPQAPPMQGFGYPNQYQNQNGNERKRQYDNNDDEYGRKRSRGVGGPEKKYFGPPRLPCKFWQEGKCRKGDECNYLHDQT